MNKRGYVQLVILLILVSLAAVFFGYQYVKSNVEINIKDGNTEESKSNSDKQTSETATPEPPFCKNYGTFSVKKTDLLETYTVGPGETMRDVAKKVFKDETKATILTSENSQLSNYEIDEELPMGMKLYIPNEKYSEEGVSSYMKAKGNITFNSEKPMFGVSAPNTGTGPFIISDTIKDSLKDIKNGDCVEVIYGSRGYDPQKVVFEVTKQ